MRTRSGGHLIGAPFGMQNLVEAQMGITMGEISHV